MLVNQTRCSTAWWLAFFIFLAGFCPVAQAQLPAFPGAQGFGRFSTGGRGGAVYHVTNLNDSGNGSFRTNVAFPNRTIVFDVGGVIRLSNVVSVANNVTIAGQTAPGGGVTFYGHRLSYSGSDNSITRFIRVRMGNHADGLNSPATGDDNDSITIANGHDMIFDHLSVSWGQDETFSISGSNPTNISIQSTIISQGLLSHSAGGLIQTVGGVSILRSFYIDNVTRNPKVKGVNEYINNVVYNWGTDAYILGGDSVGDTYANVIGNYFISGPSSIVGAFDRGNLNFHLYATNNWQDLNLNGALDGVLLTQSDYDVNDWQAAPFAYPVTNALPPLTALKLAVSDAGDSWQRDSVDAQMFTELTSCGTLGETITSEWQLPMNGPGVINGGTPYLDTDQDGMPDFWESGTGSNPSVANNNDPSPSGSGYTRLEDYLNWLADPHGIVLTNTVVNVDLRQFTQGFLISSPAYSVTAASNGVVTLMDGHVAQFVPIANYIGTAGFQFTVVDGDGSTITRPMNLFFTPLAQSFNPIWHGDDVTNNWSTLGDNNWFDGNSLLFPFHAGDKVTFDDSGSTNPAVNLIGSLQPSSMTVNAVKNYTFSGTGSLGGAMTLNKTGSGTLTMNTTNNFSGATTISSGAVIVNGSLSQSAMTVLSGGMLGGGGSLGLSPVLNSGANISPGNGIGGAGTLTISNSLTESGGVINRFDLSDDPTGLVKTNDQIKVIGAMSVSGNNSIRVNLLNGPLLNGIYTLFKYSSFVGSVTNFTLINANGVLTNPPGEIDVYVNNVRTPGNLKWVGNGVNNNWDTGSTTDWLNGANADVFYFFDSPIFDDTGSTNPAINLIGTNTPQSVMFNATKNYTLGGSGRISGFGTLTKTNSGTLTILATNDFAGPTVIAGGTLSVPIVANGGIASPLGAADNTSGNLVLSGGTLRYTGANGSTDRGMTLNPNGGTIEVSSSVTTLTQSGVIVGTGVLNKTGTGSLSLNGVNTFSGGTTVKQGKVILGNDAGLGAGVITLNGGTNGATFQFNNSSGTLNNTLNVIGTNNFTLNVGSGTGNNSVSDMTGDGTLTLNNGTTFSFTGDMTAFSGTIAVGTVTNPRFYPSLGNPNPNIGTGSSNAVFDLGNASVTLNNRNGGITVYIGALIGGANTFLEGATSASNPTTYVIGGRNLDTTFAGKIFEVIPARTASITKVGTGTLTLTGANTHTGATTIDGGILLVNNTSGSATGTNSVTVNSGGTLGGTGFIFGPVIVNSGGAIAPGTASIGILTLRSNLTLNAGTTLNFKAGVGIVSSDRVAVTNNLVLGGTLNVTNLAGFAAGTYTLFTYGKTLSGTLPVIGAKPSGYSLTLNTNTPGQVRLIVQAQTPPVFGKVIISDGAVIFSGTGGPTNVSYYVLNSTNLTLPLAAWTRLATNQFNATGGFSFTNAISTASPPQFFILQLP
jgi:autotransporter-associated beta strand protein